jgi:quercetin dioxygenase-like cupin family protein
MGTVHRRRSGGRDGPDAAWDGVDPQAYPHAELAGVLKHELIGTREGANSYTIRYFHVPAGGRTARESHPHDHGVMILSGRARVTLGSQVHELSEGDVVYVEGDELHCFEALGPQPLGFLCVVPPRGVTSP